MYGERGSHLRRRSSGQGLLYGGDLLNRRNDIVDLMKDEVFLGGTLEDQDIGTVTIFQGDLRIATNVLDDEGKRALGRGLSRPVYAEVLEQG